MGQNAKSYSTINSEPDDEILRCAQDDSQDPSPVRSREAYLQLSSLPVDLLPDGEG